MSEESKGQRPIFDYHKLVSAGIKLVEGQYPPELKVNKLSHVEEAMKGRGLFADYNNEVTGLLATLHCVEEKVLEENAEITPLKHYEDRYQEKEIFADFCVKKRIMELSNPEYIKKLDALVDEINKHIIEYNAEIKKKVSSKRKKRLKEIMEALKKLSNELVAFVKSAPPAEVKPSEE